MIRYGIFFSFDLCLHNQRVQDGISRSANKCDRCFSYQNGTKKMHESTSATKIFLKFEMLWVKTFSTQRRRRAVTCVIQNSLLNLRFSRHKRRTRVLDPDRAQPCWRPWPQERPLLKLSNNAIHWINLYTADNTIGFPNTNSLDSGDLFGVHCYPLFELRHGG